MKKMSCSDSLDCLFSTKALSLVYLLMYFYLHLYIYILYFIDIFIDIIVTFLSENFLKTNGA